MDVLYIIGMVLALLVGLVVGGYVFLVALVLVMGWMTVPIPNVRPHPDDPTYLLIGNVRTTLFDFYEMTALVFVGVGLVIALISEPLVDYLFEYTVSPYAEWPFYLWDVATQSIPLLVTYSLLAFISYVISGHIVAWFMAARGRDPQAS